MKLPKCVVGVLVTILTSAILGGFAWAWNQNAATASNKATVDALNTKVNGNKEDVNADIKELKDAIVRMDSKNDAAHLEIKNDNAEMKRVLFHIARGKGDRE
jgi:peptidoglycan hydrolase CwlO-like protein